MIEITDTDGIESVLAKLKANPDSQKVILSRSLFLYLVDCAMSGGKKITTSRSGEQTK